MNNLTKNDSILLSTLEPQFLKTIMNSLYFNEIHDVRARDPRILTWFHYVNAHVIHVLICLVRSIYRTVLVAEWFKSWDSQAMVQGPGCLSLLIGDEDHSPLGIA